MRTIVLLAGLVFVSGVAFGAPLTPAITSHDFNFGAFNGSDNVEYHTNGNQPDTLIYDSPKLPLRDHEVTAYWPDWPNNPVYPVFDVTGHPHFGGDFVLGVQFTGQDAPYVGKVVPDNIDVSLTGTGLYTDPGTADLWIYGTVTIDQITYTGLLWALDLDNVSLYGFSSHDAYVLEGIGTIVGGLIAEANGLIDTPGAMRGHLDFLDRPDFWIPALYDPLGPAPLESIRADYSGETGGAVPEPATVALVVSGLGILLARRKKT
jgi:hypothetical protein